MKNKNLAFSILIAATVYSNAIFAYDFAVAGFVKGKVSILNADDTSKLWKAFKTNDVLKPGDTLKTGNGSKVDLIFKETEFRIQPNTTFALKEWDTKKQVSKIYIETGAAWFKVKDFKKGTFEVSSPTSTAGVRGTAFGVYFMPKEKKAYTCVCEGKVDVNGTIFNQGTGAGVTEGVSDIEKNEYKALFKKEGKEVAMATVDFQKKMKDVPMLSNCLSCHKPIGWEAKGITADEKYGK
jgi:hypothetical protein